MYVLVPLNTNAVDVQAVISCGSGHLILNVNEAMNVTCANAGRWAQIYPVLPAGLRYSNGVIQGTPVEPMPLTTYTISTMNDRGEITIGGIFLFHCIYPCSCWTTYLYFYWFFNSYHFYWICHFAHPNPR